MNKLLNKKLLLVLDIFLSIILILIIYLVLNNILNKDIICPKKISFYEYIRVKIANVIWQKVLSLEKYGWQI